MPKYNLNIFKNKNCELLTLENEYIPLMTLNYKCICGNIIRTKGCFNKNNDVYIKICKENGCEFIDKYSEKTTVKIKFKCKCNEIQIKKITQFKKFPMCTKCTYKIRSIGRRNTIDRLYIKKEFEKKKCKLLTPEYTSAFQILYVHVEIKLKIHIIIYNKVENVKSVNMKELCLQIL
jgi:hypothetical protein